MDRIMKQGPHNPRRMKGRGPGRRMPNSRNQSFDSNGPDVKVRGNAQQVVDKYLALARDASSSGDRIAAESYYQHAEHYYRVLSASAPHKRNGRMPGTHDRPEGQGDTDGEQSPSPRHAPASHPDPAQAPQPQVYASEAGNPPPPGDDDGTATTA